MKIIRVNTKKYGSQEILLDDDILLKINSISAKINLAKAKNKLYVNLYFYGIRIGLHRFIMEVKDSSVFVDHIDGNPLNNMRNNLRLCNNQQNMMNQRKHKNSTSIYKGVCKEKLYKKWTAQIIVNGKKKFLGRYKNEIDAAKAYDKAALELHGEFANTNNINTNSNG